MKFDKVKYDNEFAKNNYDRIIVNVPKGKKQTIDNFRKQKGYISLNQYINELIRKDMNETDSKEVSISVGDIKQEGDGNSISIG